MALGLNRIWVRFGLWITAAVLLAIASLAIGVLAFSELQYREFYRHLPSPVRTELEALKSQDLEDSPRALQIYSEYWEGDRLFGEKWSLVIGLAVSLPFGMAVGFWICDASPVRWPPWWKWLRAWSVAIWPPEPSRAMPMARWPR